MKYFTKEWWESGGEDQSRVDAYCSYINSVKKNLPAGVCQLIDNYNFHDSSIIGLSVDLKNNNVGLRFVGWDDKFEKKVCYKIGLKNVRVFEVFSGNDIEEEPQGIEFGDLGYYEFEFNRDEAIELRMLFSSYVELKAEFKDLDIEVHDY